MTFNQINDKAINFSEAKLSKVIINKSNMNYALFQDSEISEFIVMLCDFSSSNFRRVKLTNFNFYSGNLKNSTFYQAIINNSKIFNSYLAGINFSKSNLINVSVNDSNLSYYNFRMTKIDNFNSQNNFIKKVLINE